MDSSRIDALGDELYDALRTQQSIAPLTAREPTRPLYISYAVFCLKKKKRQL